MKRPIIAMSVLVCALFIAAAIVFTSPMGAAEAPAAPLPTLGPPRDEGSGSLEFLVAAADDIPVPPAPTATPVPTPEPTVEPTLEPAPEPEPRRTYLGRYYVCGYDICIECCGKTDGITASGAVATIGRTVAAPKSVPFGTVLYIEGIGERVVEDRGGFPDYVLDVLCEDHDACYAITGWYNVYIIEE